MDRLSVNRENVWLRSEFEPPPARLPDPPDRRPGFDSEDGVDLPSGDRRDDIFAFRGPRSDGASTLFTEDAKDGQVNCLDQAVDLLDGMAPGERRRSELVLLDDVRAGAAGTTGHAVVRQGDEVIEPATGKRYASTADYLRENSQYREAGTLSGDTTRKIFQTPAGSSERARVLAEVDVPPALAKMLLADPPQPSPQPPGYTEAEPRREPVRTQHPDDQLQPGPAPVAPGQVAPAASDPGPELLRQYDALRAAGPPRRSDYPHPQIYREDEQYYDMELARLSREAAPYLLRRNEEFARQTPTGRAIVDQARKQGAPIEVLPDAEYDRRHPGTGGVTVGGKVFVPLRSIHQPDDANVVVHEYIHAVLGDAMRPDRPQAERVARLRDKFQELGLDPADGERLARVTEGWQDGVAADHVATAVLGADMARERAGKPPLSPQARDEMVERNAHRELALSLVRRQDEASSGGPAFSDKQLVDAWLATPQGRAEPPPGNTDAERAANLRPILDRYADESYVRDVN
jgi:hypothetical protein